MVVAIDLLCEKRPTATRLHRVFHHVRIPYRTLRRWRLERPAKPSLEASQSPSSCPPCGLCPRRLRVASERLRSEDAGSLLGLAFPRKTSTTRKNAVDNGGRHESDCRRRATPARPARSVSGGAHVTGGLCCAVLTRLRTHENRLLRVLTAFEGKGEIDANTCCRWTCVKSCQPPLAKNYQKGTPYRPQSTQ